jgi:hypothetical protein
MMLWPQTLLENLTLACIANVISVQILRKHADKIRSDGPLVKDDMVSRTAHTTDYAHNK